MDSQIKDLKKGQHQQDNDARKREIHRIRSHGSIMSYLESLTTTTYLSGGLKMDLQKDWQRQNRDLNLRQKISLRVSISRELGSQIIPTVASIRGLLATCINIFSLGGTQKHQTGNIIKAFLQEDLGFARIFSEAIQTEAEEKRAESFIEITFLQTQSRAEKRDKHASGEQRGNVLLN